MTLEEVREIKKILTPLLLALTLVVHLLSVPVMAADPEPLSQARWTSGRYSSSPGDMAGRRLYVYGIVDSEKELTEKSTDKDILLSADQAAGRLDTALYLYRLCGSEAKGDCPFSDVPEQYADAVAWLYSQGIVQGIGNGLYGLGDITEHQLLLMLSRLLGWETEDDGELLSIAGEKELLPEDRKEGFITRGELFQILCALLDAYRPERCVPVRPEMSTPFQMTVNADDGPSALR